MMSTDRETATLRRGKEADKMLEVALAVIALVAFDVFMSSRRNERD